MNFNNRGNQQFYSTNCSIFGCLFTTIIISFLIRGGITFLIKNFWLILALGLVIWIFRTFIRPDRPSSPSLKNEGQNRGDNWNRDFEQNKDTAYHNIERDFEEIDEVDEEDEEFKDF